MVLSKIHYLDLAEIGEKLEKMSTEKKTKSEHFTFRFETSVYKEDTRANGHRL